MDHRCAHIAALDHLRTGGLDAHLEIRQPELRSFPASALRDRQKLLNLDLRGGEQRGGHRSRARQDGMLHKQFGGKPAHPIKELPEPTPPNELEVPLDQQLGDQIWVAGSGSVLDRLLREPVRVTPRRRAAAELASGVAPELELKNLAEEVVVAIPLAAIVERDEEHVRVREVGEHRNRVLAAENRVAQCRREAPQHRRAHQEVLDLRRERRQNLVGQIFPNLAGAARELPHSPVGVPQIPKPQSGQIDARGPSLRAIDKQLHALGGQADPLTNDKLARFLDREGQLPSADLR